MVKLGITTAVVFVPRYRGNTTATSWPCATSAFGSASTTSARPPVFENGSPSDATNRTLTVCSLRAPQSFYAIGHYSARQVGECALDPFAGVGEVIDAAASLGRRPVTLKVGASHLKRALIGGSADFECYGSPPETRSGVDH